MPDPYAVINPEIHERLIAVLETRAVESRQQVMKYHFLRDIQFPPESSVLEVGCGTGVLCRALANLPNIQKVLGLDHSGVFLAKARELSVGFEKLIFMMGDGRSLSFRDSSLDAVIFYTTLCHIVNPYDALSEAFRVLKKDGMLAIFDGDYTTPTVSICNNDPLQSCVGAAMDAFVFNRTLFGNISDILRDVGFVKKGTNEFEYYAEISQPGYMTTLVERGADYLCFSGDIGEELAAALKKELQHRVAAGKFFGRIIYRSVYAQKP